jgi:chemotaxis protein MotB
MSANKSLFKMRKNIRFTETREGLRIDLIDEADFSMFALATDRLLPAARTLIGEVAKVIQTVPNDVIVRGHTDGLPYAAGRTMNNWLLSSARAEATRAALNAAGLGNGRFAKIEGVADREPFIPTDIYDPRNRRMSIVLSWSQNKGGADADPGADDAGQDAATRAAIRERDNPMKKMKEAATAANMGTTALPRGAVIINAADISTSTKPGKH